MGLITKEVEVNVVGGVVSYYENLGYTIPRTLNKQGKFVIPSGSTMIVNVCDLPVHSGINVELECDYCHVHYNAKYCNYMNHNHDGKTYCVHCAPTILQSGENNPCYKPEKTDEERFRERKYPEYMDFTKRVLARDHYTCYVCGHKHSNLIVHHLNGYSWDIKGRLDDSNAVVVCSSCHKIFHDYYGIKNNTRAQFEEWVGHPLEDFEKCDIFIPKTREVFCVEDNRSYYTSVDAAKHNGVHPSSIRNNCNRKSRHVHGKHYIWLDEYEKMDEEDIKDYLNWANRPIERCDARAVLCIEDGNTYRNAEAAADFYKVSASSIYRNANGKTKYTLVGHFIYVDEFDSLDDCAKAELFEKYHRKGAA